MVVGYGMQKKSLVTGSIAKVNDEKITQTKNPALNNHCRERCPGLPLPRVLVHPVQT